MPVAGEFVEIIMKGELIGQLVVNVRQYQVTEVVNDGGITDILDYWENSALPEIANAQSVQFEWGEVIVNNISDGVEFGQRSISVPGLVTGDCLPPHTAASIKLQRGNKETRNGYMRLAGIAESYQVDGLLTSGAVTTILDRIDMLIGAQVCGTAPDTITINPVIMGRNTDGSYDLTRWQYPASITVQDVVTTQRSRKIGVGR